MVDDGKFLEAAKNAKYDGLGWEDVGKFVSRQADEWMAEWKAADRDGVWGDSVTFFFCQETGSGRHIWLL